MRIKEYWLLLAYAISSDFNSSIHSEQIEFMTKCLKRTPKLLEQAYNIIKEKNRAKDISDLINSLTYEKPAIVNKFQKKIIFILCMNGNFDKFDEQFYCNIFNNIPPDKKIINKYLRKFKKKINKKFFLKSTGVKLSFLKNIYFSLFSSKRITTSFMLSHKNKKHHEKLISNLNNSIIQIQDYIEKNLNEIIDISKCSFIDVESEPSVAIVGRTRAGKSTFFQLLSGCDDRLIGNDGKQRTTRYSTITHVDGIKWVDTPGVGSAYSEGRNDEKKAKQSSIKCDYICMLITDDSIDESTQNLLTELCKANKPVSILINRKTQIESNDYTELSEEMKNWVEHDNTNGFNGLKNEMINILDNNNSNNIAYFYPINLYLAGLYRKSFFKDLKYKKTSGFSYAYNCMSEKVKQNYLLYRTSHIVADTILSKILDTCYKLKKICKLQKKQLKEKEIITKNTKNSINEWNNRCRKVLKTKIDCLCDLLESELNSINSKKADKINKRIEEIIKRFCDNAQQELSVFIHEEINKLREELNTKYSNKIHEGFKNKDLLFNNSIQEFNENQHVIGAHEVLWGVGKVGVLAMFIPGLNVAVTGTLFITTIVLDIVSNKFTHSFSERRKEFNQKLDNFKKEIINTIKSELLKNTNKNIDDIVNYFLDATNQAYKYLEQQYYTFETNTSNHIEYLNDKLESMLYIYSLFFLSMQQPKAIFKNKYLIFEKEKPVLKINVNNGKNEIWSETYMQVEILNGD